MRNLTAVVAVITLILTLAGCASTGGGKAGSVERRLADIEKLSRKLDDESFNKLISYLADPEESVRMAALMQLFDRKDRRSAKPVAGLIDDPVPEIREKSVELLGLLDEPEILPDLIEAFGHEDYQLSRMAVSAVRNFGAAAAPVLIDALGADQQRIRDAAVETLVLLDPPPVELVARELTNPQRGPGARAVLVRTADRALTGLSIVALDASMELAVKIAEVIGEIGDPRGMDTLRILAAKPEADVRIAAARAMGQAGKDQSAEPLAMLLGDTDPAVRNTALEALRPYVHPGLEDQFFDALNDPATQVNALLDLGALNSKKAIRELGKTIKSKHAHIRLASVQAMTLSRNETHVPALTRALSDSDSDVRLASISGLAAIDTATAQKALAKHYSKAKTCRERSAIYDYLQAKGAAAKLPLPMDKMKDVCSVCGQCATYQDEAKVWFCDVHKPSVAPGE